MSMALGSNEDGKAKLARERAEELKRESGADESGQNNGAGTRKAKEHGKGGSEDSRSKQPEEAETKAKPEGYEKAGPEEHRKASPGKTGEGKYGRRQQHSRAEKEELEQSQDGSRTSGVEYERQQRDNKADTEAMKENFGRRDRRAEPGTKESGLWGPDDRKAYGEGDARTNGGNRPGRAETEHDRKAIWATAVCWTSGGSYSTSHSPSYSTSYSTGYSTLYNTRYNIDLSKAWIKPEGEGDDEELKGGQTPYAIRDARRHKPYAIYGERDASEIPGNGVQGQPRGSARGRVGWAIRDIDEDEDPVRNVDQFGWATRGTDQGRPGEQNAGRTNRQETSYIKAIDDRREGHQVKVVARGKKGRSTTAATIAANADKYKEVNWYKRVILANTTDKEKKANRDVNNNNEERAKNDDNKGREAAAGKALIGRLGYGKQPGDGNGAKCNVKEFGKEVDNNHKSSVSDGGSEGRRPGRSQ